MQNRQITRSATATIHSGKKALENAKQDASDSFSGVIHEMSDRFSDVQNKLTKFAKKEWSDLEDVGSEISRKSNGYYRKAVRTVRARPVASVSLAMVAGAALGSAILASVWKAQQQVEE